MPLPKILRLFGTPPSDANDSTLETRTQRITIGDEDCVVTAHRTGKKSWTAYGYVHGTPMHAADETAPGAFSRWRVMAQANPGR